MNTENDIKEFGFRHISINTVYNGLVSNSVKPLSRPCYESILSENLADAV